MSKCQVHNTQGEVWSGKVCLCSSIRLQPISTPFGYPVGECALAIQPKMVPTLSLRPVLCPDRQARDADTQPRQNSSASSICPPPPQPPSVSSLNHPSQAIRPSPILEPGVKNIKKNKGVINTAKHHHRHAILRAIRLVYLLCPVYLLAPGSCHTPSCPVPSPVRILSRFLTLFVLSWPATAEGRALGALHLSIPLLDRWP